MDISNSYKYIKIKDYDLDKRNLSYVAGVGLIGMAYKLSLANIDIADALIAEKEAMLLYENYYKYYLKLTPLMIMNISISAIRMSENLGKYATGLQKFSV